MQIVDLKVTAGQVVSWYGQARYFSLYKAVDGVKISTDTGINTNFYQGIGGDIAGENDQLCTVINFIAETTQTIQFAVSDIVITDNRVAGEVEVNGVVRVDTSTTNPSFVHNVFNASVVGFYGSFAIGNPANSTVDVLINKINIMNTTSGVYWVYVNRGGLGVDYQPYNNALQHGVSIDSATTSQAMMVDYPVTPAQGFGAIGPDWGAQLNIDAVFAFMTTAGSGYVLELSNPIVLNPDDEMIVQPWYAGSGMMLSAEFQERER